MTAEAFIDIRAEFPAKLRPLFQPRRYKVMHGGRGGGKSWAVARALLLMAADRPLRILCAREVQKSMRDSVHRLLKDQVVALNLTDEFEILDNEIRGANGSLFLFTGLQALQHATRALRSVLNRYAVDSQRDAPLIDAALAPLLSPSFSCPPVPSASPAVAVSESALIS